MYYEYFNVYTYPVNYYRMFKTHIQLDVCFSFTSPLRITIYLFGFQSHHHNQGHMATSSFYWWRKTHTYKY